MRQSVLSLAALLLLGAGNARADLVPIGPSAFPPGSPLLTFDGLADGTQVNGLVYSGVTFHTLLGGVQSNAIAIIDGGPGPTNNITPPNIVSINGTNSGVALEVILPTPATEFGFGFADLDTRSIPNAATIELFSGSTSLGSLTFPGAPDPFFTGGFAGVSSTIPFDRALLTFTPGDPAFAADKSYRTKPRTLARSVSEEGCKLFPRLRFGLVGRRSDGVLSGSSNIRFAFIAPAVPEPGSLALFGLGAATLLGWCRWRKQVPA